MKTGLSMFLIIILSAACNQTIPPPSISEELFLKMHLIIERSGTDTVKYRMEQFIKKNNFSMTASLIKSGKYSGESPYDDYGYKHVISFEIKDGKFSDIKYNEIKENGQGKFDDTTYCRLMNEAVSGSAPNLSYPSYIRQLYSKQDLKRIDAVTGATYSKFRFQYAALRAIVKGPVEKK